MGLSTFLESSGSNPQNTPVNFPVEDLILYLSPFILIASIFFVFTGAAWSFGKPAVLQ